MYSFIVGDVAQIGGAGAEDRDRNARGAAGARTEDSRRGAGGAVRQGKVVRGRAGGGRGEI